MKNGTINKIIVITLIMIILLNWTLTYIAFGASTNETLDDISVKQNIVGQTTYPEVKRKAVEELRKQLETKYNYKGTVEELAETCGIDLTIGSAGEELNTSGKQIKIDDDTTIILGFDMTIETGADKSNITTSNPYGTYVKVTIEGIKVIKNTGIDNNEQNNQNASNSNTINSNNEIVVNSRNYVGNTDWDLGGVFLKPFFFLINCVVDTLLGFLQKIMYSDVTDQNKITNFVKTNYIDKLRVVDSRNIDTMFDLYTNQLECTIGIESKIGSTEYPHIHYSPEEIFSGQISLLNIDFISGEGQAEGLGVVRTTIASWYNTLRLIATAGFLSVLIYIGIKILLSASSKDKAKYKEWIIDWIIGIAMLYTMHYLMSFIITIINQFNESMISVIPILRVQPGNGFDEFSTNLIGLVRFCTQYDLIGLKIGFEIMYIMLVVYTFKFTFVYIRRVIYMAFLTVIAPIVAFTYPIDKSLDGKAQGFSMWIKEFFYNALLQPVHYLIYYVMVFSSIQIAVDNPFYAIAVLAFMAEAERLIKKIFGFEKAHEGTVGGLGTALSGLSIIKGAKMLTGRKKSLAQVSSTRTMQYPGAVRADYEDSDFVTVGNSNYLDYSNDSSYDENSEDNNEDNSNNDNNFNNNNNAISQQTRNVSNNTDSQIPTIDANQSTRPRLMGKIEDPKKKVNPYVKQLQPVLTPIKKMANNVKQSPVGQKAIYVANSKAGRVTRAIGKKVVRPIWDFDKSGKYNSKRLFRNVIKGTIGISVGITATAVQAGISLTDGKYSPKEGLAAFSAGVAFAGMGVDKTANTFEEAVNESNVNEKMEIYKEQFINRDDVIQFCKENYGSEWKEYRKRIVDNYVSRGFTNLDEIKKGIIYANNMANEVNESRTYLTPTQKKKTLKQEKKKQDVIAMYIMSQKRKRAKIQASHASYNKRVEDKYIHSITQGMNNRQGLGPQQGATVQQGNMQQRGLGPQRVVTQNQVEKVRRQERAISAAIRTFDRITNS